MSKEKEKFLKTEIENLEKKNQELSEKLEVFASERELEKTFDEERKEFLRQMLDEFDALGVEFRKVVDELKSSRDELQTEIDTVRSLKNELTKTLEDIYNDAFEN